MTKAVVSVPDWRNWVPREYGVLCFIIKDGQILLIHKKRGLGAGKVNGPGGRLEAGESPMAGAIRETQEEVGLTPSGLNEIGNLCFQFCDGYSLRCTVFRANDWAGELQETDEAKPFWQSVAEIPYDLMWADDELWLPYLLAGNYFEGRFVFDGERMLFHEVLTHLNC